MARKKDKPGWRKRLVRALALLAGVAVSLVIALGLFVKSYLTKDLLEREIEKSINSEVAIGEVRVSLFSFPAKVTLMDVRLSPRGAKPGSKPPIRIGAASLSMALEGLLKKHIHVTAITIRDAEITNTFHRDGTTSLQQLFESPDAEKRRRPEDEGGGFNIHEQRDFVTTLGGVSVENARLELILEGMGMRLVCEDLNARLGSIRVDPDDLDGSNHAKLRMDTHILIDSLEGKPYADLQVEGAADARIFNPRTGYAEPDVDCEFQLGEASWLNAQIPFVTRAWNYLSVLQKVGISVGTLPEKATFGRSKSISVHYHQGLATVQKPLSIWLGDWEVALLEEGWLNVRTDAHKVRGELVASEKSSALLQPVIMKGVELLPQQLRQPVARDVEENLFREDRLLVKIKSSGNFSDPRIRADGKIIDLSKATRDAAREMLQQKAGDALKGLLK